jgi:hypothetical protein
MKIESHVKYLGLAVIIGIAAYWAGHRHGYWEMAEMWAVSNADVKAQRLSCWEKDHNARYCVDSDVFVSMKYVVW